jgi:hypothetical protein
LKVGLAVDDIKAVQDQAVLNRLAMQARLVLDVEAALPEFVRRRSMLRQETVLPRRLRFGFLKRFMGDQSSLSGILASLEGSDEDVRNFETLYFYVHTIKSNIGMAYEFWNGTWCDTYARVREFATKIFLFFERKL